MRQRASTGQTGGRKSVGQTVALAAASAGFGLAAVTAGIGVGAVLPVTAGAASPTVVTVAHDKTWGTILTLSNGDTLYRLTTDPAGRSVCTGACAKAWPPVLLGAGQKSPTGRGVSGLGTIARSGGQRQVTYKGVPLYLYVGDHSSGQVNGNIKDTWGQWWVVNPAHPRAVPTAAKSSSGGGSSPTTAGSGVAY